MMRLKRSGGIVHIVENDERGDSRIVRKPRLDLLGSFEAPIRGFVIDGQTIFPKNAVDLQAKRITLVGYGTPMFAP